MMRDFYVFVFILALINLPGLVVTQCADNLPCFAPSIDVSKLPGYNLTINSTCGTPPEDFCVGTDCLLNCDASNPQTSHPQKLILDPFEQVTYWKSKNFDEPVYIKFDFGSKLILQQITITFQFEFPNGLFIQKSSDGKTFLTLMYYAIRCNDTFNLPKATFYNRLDVLCFDLNPSEIQKQVSYAPRRDNYVATEVLKGGFVRDYYLATNIKIVLQEFYKPADFNLGLADSRKFYFAIRDVDIQAACYCNGMSNQCNANDFGVCVCQKNTEGKNCEHCQSLYNNKLWTFGIACEACMCNNHASSCFYNPSKGYGICKNCNDNTKGDKCDLCETGYYRNISILITSKDACTACNCEMDGVKYGSTVCEPLTGNCLCKSNVMGDRCEICKDGYYGLSGNILNGCNSCACSSSGTLNSPTVCNKQSGQCPCKTGFTDRRCSKCEGGYYGYPVGAPSECKECDCSAAGSLNMTCDLSGQCFCRINYFGRQCNNIRVGYFSASVWQLWFSSLAAKVSSPVADTFRSLNITDSSGNTFFILGYVLGLDPSTNTVTKLTYNIDIPRNSNYEVFLQYMAAFKFSNVQIVFELLTPFSRYSCDNGATFVEIDTNVNLLANLASTRNTGSFGTACLTKGSYKVDVWFPPNSAGFQSSSATIFVMAMLLLPKYQNSVRYLSANLQTKAEIQKYYMLAQTVRGWSQEESNGALYMSYLYGSLFDQALGCNCDSAGTINPSVCNVYGGQCNCKQNIYERTCASCLPEHYNFTSGLGCAGCACDLRGSHNNSCDSQSGQCPCKANVIGRTCNRCALNYYGIASNKGCQPCACSRLYSTSSTCDENGNCKCKPGVSSAKCNQCAAGYYDLKITGCKSCICNPLGTAGNKCNPTTGACNCKSLVMGEKCQKCMVGYYGYSSDFPDTCLKCHCTDKTSDCDVAPGYYLLDVNTTFSTRKNNLGVEGWSTVNLNGQQTGKGVWKWAPEYSVEAGYIELEDTGNDPQLFFSAPSIFLGNKRSSYMYHLTFDMTQKSSTHPPDRNRDVEGDVIMKGKNMNYKLVAVLADPPKVFQKFESLKVQFYEEKWFKDSTKGEKPTNIEMLNTLSNLEYIYIRGKWTTNGGEFSGISNVVMQYSTYNITNPTGLSVARNVEYCNCPVAYSGQFCQECNVGFTRDPIMGDANDNCVACACNGHAFFCDISNGTCSNCLHNTIGRSCELCADGFYGLAKTGQPDDCKSCMCPGGPRMENQFATKCALDKDNSFSCTDCQVGYTGRRCEICSDGYYGNPMHPSRKGKCEKCTCNNNIDSLAAGNCNTTTGECLRCLYNTIGQSCEYCRPGYFGDAIAKSCRACSCNVVGSLDSACQNMTGQCNCRANVVGRICDECAVNTFNFKDGNGCQTCNCHLKGSLTQQCNLVTGKCQCKPRVIGEKCDQCAPGFYNLEEGCLPCNCNKSFTMENTTCNAVSGQCNCRDSSLGGPYSGRTCSECSVNAIGSPPNCELCHSPCYDNWQRYIDNEASDIAKMQANVTMLLSKFGGMTYERIESELAWLNGNLTASSKVFSGARYNTSEKLEQFQKIETRIVEFESVLERVDQQLESSESFFKTTVSSFNGTVFLSAQIPQPASIPLIKIRVRRDVQLIPKGVDAEYVIKMAEGYISSSRTNNMSGQVIYTTILNEYNQIVAANTTISEASKKLSDAILDLSKSVVEREKIENILDTQYKAAFATNDYELKKIHDIVASISIMQNKTVTIHQAALSTLASAQTVIDQAESDANKRRSEALSVSQDVSQMKVDAITLKTNAQMQQNVAADLKLKVDDVLIDVTKELEALAKGVLDIAVARTTTLQVLRLAYEIGNMTIPITLQEIEELSLKIQNTAINEGMINSTFAHAQNGLRKAQEVQKRSTDALDVSQNTLKEIQNLELSMSQASALRQDSIRIQTETDLMMEQIQNVSAKIDQQYNTVNGQGDQTLSLLSSAIHQAQSNKMCFVNAKAVIDNATLVSEEARQTAIESYAIHQTNAQQIPQYATTINEMYHKTSTTHAQAKSARNNAQTLLSDVTEAESLLNEFKSQQNELQQLEAETSNLEAELNDLLVKFNKERIKFESCNKP